MYLIKKGDARSIDDDSLAFYINEFNVQLYSILLNIFWALPEEQLTLTDDEIFDAWMRVANRPVET